MNNVSKGAKELLSKAKKQTKSKFELFLLESLLKYGFVRTIRKSGYSINDKTNAFLILCEKIGLKVNSGNDAPRGGKIGNFVKNDNDPFLIKSNALFLRKSQIEKAKELRLETESYNRKLKKKIQEFPTFIES